MNEIKTEIAADKLADVIVKGLQEVKAKDITILDLREIEGAVASFFIVCHGDSTTHVDGMAGSVEREVKSTIHERPWSREGTDNSQWILLDYVNVVVHIFLAETRSFYNIEGLWADAKIEKIENLD